MNLASFYTFYTAKNPHISDSERTSLNENCKVILREFRTMVLTAGLISKYKINVSPTGVVDDSYNDSSCPNLEKFHLKLIMLVMKVMNEENLEKEPIKSIRMYFALQGRGTSRVPEELKYSSSGKSLGEFKESLKKVFEGARNRKLSYLHEKFFLLNKKENTKRDSSKIVDAINEQSQNCKNYSERINKPVVLDGYSARSIIIALHRVMKPGLIVTFMIGDSCVNYKTMNNYGRVFINTQMYTLVGNQRKIKFENRKADMNSEEIRLHALTILPYDKNTVIWLSTLQKQLAKDQGLDLMDQILKRFSHSLRAFELGDFELQPFSITEEHVHFLNAFSFLTQIVEVARYLRDKWDVSGRKRYIVEMPIALCGAIAKRTVKTDLKADFHRLYDDSNMTAKEVTTSRGLKDKKETTITRINSLFSSANEMRLIDKLPEKLNETACDTKVGSSASVLTFLKSNYGSGSESDSDDSIDSFSDQAADLTAFGYEKRVSEWLKQLEKRTDTDLMASSETAQSSSITEIASGDSNFFYRNVINQMKSLNIKHPTLNVQHENSHHHLRHLVSGYIRQHWTEIQRFVAGDPEQFISTFRIQGEWVDHLMIVATAKFLNLDISIKDRGRNVVVKACDQEIQIEY